MAKFILLLSDGHHHGQHWPLWSTFLLLILLILSPYVKSDSSVGVISKTHPTSSSSSLSSLSTQQITKKSGANSQPTTSTQQQSSSSSSSVNPSGTVGASWLPSFLYSTFSTSSVNGIPNPYPFRTMIGNLMFRLRQHRTQMLVIPSLLRIVYQYRRPIVDGLATAYQTFASAKSAVPASAPSAVDLAAGGARISHSDGTDPTDPLMVSASNQHYDTGPGTLFVPYNGAGSPQLSTVHLYTPSYHHSHLINHRSQPTAAATFFPSYQLVPFV